MWLMPSYGRPHVLRDLLEAPGGWPASVTVLVNEDDPQRQRYEEALDALLLGGAEGLASRRHIPWHILIVPPGSRFAEAVRAGFEFYPDDPFFGIIDDDYWPVTPGWYERMVDAAGPNGIAIANNKVNFPSPYTCRVMGGELARAIGTIAPGTMRHNFSDDTWGSFAKDFGLMHPLEDVIVEHRHHLFDKEVVKDTTYDRGSVDFEEDKRRYTDWRSSDERREQCKRVAKLLGGEFTVSDFSGVHLLILVPIQNNYVDIAFHHSFYHTTAMLAQKRISFTVQEAAGGSHIGKAREHVLWAGLKECPKATHVLYIDDDMGWDEKLITRFLAADHDFAAASGVKKVDPLTLCYNSWPDPQVEHPITKFLKIRHVGFAFVLLKRCVIERLCDAYPELEYNTDGHGREWALFADDFTWVMEAHSLPERLSEDFAFCHRWNKIGGEIWLDLHAKLIHAGRKEYTGSPIEFYAARQEAAANAS